ncbi:hypothetical protein [Shinella zoogloeoides]|uniref:hypothetical protein n=1 Tax=Shinella zoogloeoides TaxID=352475 RepID=UPI0028ADB5F8|nr:hypothetical protein [Shinella zoogloeoides]
MDIMEINARCLAKCLPDMDAAERAVMEPYLKGLETYLAHRPQRAEIISFDRQVLKNPWQRETVRRRRKAVAAAREITVDEFGWEVYDGD